MERGRKTSISENMGKSYFTGRGEVDGNKNGRVYAIMVGKTSRPIKNISCFPIQIWKRLSEITRKKERTERKCCLCLIRYFRVL